MGFFTGICRTITSPIEVTARTMAKFFDFDENDELNGIDIGTLGISRVIRKGAEATKETFSKIDDEFDN